MEVKPEFIKKILRYNNIISNFNDISIFNSNLPSFLPTSFNSNIPSFLPTSEFFYFRYFLDEDIKDFFKKHFSKDYLIIQNDGNSKITFLVNLANDQSTDKFLDEYQNLTIEVSNKIFKILEKNLEENNMLILNYKENIEKKIEIINKSAQEKNLNDTAKYLPDIDRIISQIENNYKMQTADFNIKILNQSIYEAKGENIFVIDDANLFIKKKVFFNAEKYIRILVYIYISLVLIMIILIIRFYAK
jgi:hypothetical protein